MIGFGSLVILCLQGYVAWRGVPGFLLEWLQVKGRGLEAEPAYVLVLGGGGIPSESGLIRTYYAAEHGKRWPRARFVVALPAEGDPETSSVGRMKDELVMRGIRKDAILMETRGRSTREQAWRIRELLGVEALTSTVVVATSPLHLRRASMCLEAAGFSSVWPLGTPSIGVEADVGDGVSWRYRVWANLETLIEATRELAAIAFYKLRGWI